MKVKGIAYLGSNEQIWFDTCPDHAFYKQSYLLLNAPEDLVSVGVKAEIYADIREGRMLATYLGRA